MTDVQSLPLPPIPNKASANNEAQWPLAYRLRLPEGSSSWFDAPPEKRRWWTHNLYRGPNNKPPQILYSRTRAQSEEFAKQFLNEPVVGFDMEWPWDADKKSRLQDKIGLIQVACEDKIALFHIGLHAGKTPEELIAPSLRQLIENANVAKTGVAILNADFARLKRHFKLTPRGAWELSHFYRLVTFGPGRPELITTKLVSLATQVEQILGLPLSKGKVRTSNWSRPLTQKQIDYAAADAYAGFMLYHCLNAKRVAMEPTPPSPLFAEAYLPYQLPKVMSLRLYPGKGIGILTAQGFYASQEEANAEEKEQVAKETSSAATDKQRMAKTRKGPKKNSLEPLNASDKDLYDLLVKRRKALADANGIAAYLVASNSVLDGLARQRPLDDAGLLAVKGIGKLKQAKYGAEWLEVIAQFLTDKNVPSSQPAEVSAVIGVQASQSSVESLESLLVVESANPTRGRRVPTANDDEHARAASSSPAFETPPERAPPLHTGLSFTLAETDLGPSQTQEAPELGSSDMSLKVFETVPTTPLSNKKRKRSRSPFAQTKPLTPPPGEKAPLTPKARMFQSALTALSKRIVAKLDRGLLPDQVASTSVIQLIVAAPPRTLEDLLEIPGAPAFHRYCTEAQLDLMKNIAKYAPDRG